MKSVLVLGGIAAALTTFAVSLLADDKPAKPDPAAVERARDTVQMLDNVYKNVVVLITDKYVHTEEDFAAGSAAVELFRRVSKGDGQDVRLIDATGEPYEPANVAKSDFEIEGIQRLKAGAASHDEVFFKDEKPYLRAVTAVPVVHQRCVMCHSHYADVPEGQPVGAISYVVPIK